MIRDLRSVISLQLAALPPDQEGLAMAEVVGFNRAALFEALCKRDDVRKGQIYGILDGI